MNKAQKEAQQAQLSDEKAVVEQLRKIYKQARNDCERRIRELSSRTDFENLQSIIYQKQYQEALKKQLDSILDGLQGQQFTSIADYLQKSYHNGYIGVMYDLHRQGIPILMPINQDQVVKAVQTDSKLSQGLYDRLGEDVGVLKKSIRTELSRGIANGSTWNEMARQIANGMNNPYDKSINNAIRIARTEGHRVQQQSAFDSLCKAKESGADVVKQWDATLDDRTRNTHKNLDGQIREIDEYFEVNGHRALHPGAFGVASEDIHCRCHLLQRAKWALGEAELQTLKDRAAYFGLDKTKDFEDFKQKYLHLPENAGTMDLKDIQLGELESAYGKKHSAAIKKQIENAPDEVKRVWNDCVGDFHCLDPKYRGNEAYYSPNYDGVKLNISKAANGSDYQTPYQVVFHEYGHHADYILNRKYGDGDKMKSFSETYKNGIFGKTLKKEANKVIEDYAIAHDIYMVKGIDIKVLEKEADSAVKRGLITQAERGGYLSELVTQAVQNAKTIDRGAAERAFCDSIKRELTSVQRSDISDMFEPVMLGKNAYPFGFGHGTSYWWHRDNGREAFAEMYSAVVDNPESLEQIKRFFPESFKIFQEMLGEVK